MSVIRTPGSARLLFGVGAAVLWVACGSSDPQASTNMATAGATAGGASASGGSAPSSAGMPNHAGAQGLAGSTGFATVGSGSAGSSSAGATALGGASMGGGQSGGSGGTPSGGGSSPLAGTGGLLSNGSGGAPAGCSLPPTVSFKNDIQKFLGSSCGGSGCHVVDDKSTMASGGYNHVYDWITATAHASSCPSGAPKRFEIVMAVIERANPPSCSKSRIMPPDPAMHAALTSCQIAALRAWLAEPMVTQMHRADDTSPTTPYPMPPFN